MLASGAGRKELPMMPRLLIAALLLGSAAACSPAGSSSTSGSAAPGAPSALAPMGTNAAPANTTLAPTRRQDVLVNLHDACDPATFQANDVTCVRSGGVKFDQFIAELTRLGFAGPWHFAPPNANVQVGQSFVAVNKGGEVHTFTEVAQFGGGIVPQLNQLAHVPTIAPECAALEPDDFVPPGGTHHENVDHAGSLKFQCCIHPWMRLEARASTR
jgi:hypothetical protein